MGTNTISKIKKAYGPKKKRRRKPISSAAFWSKLAKTEPNNAEMQVLGILTWLKLPYRFVGNAGFIIGGKCPDFIHTGNKKKLIELFGERWHPPEDEVAKIEFYAGAGYDVLIVWQRELSIKNRKNLYERLLKFDKN